MYLLIGSLKLRPVVRFMNGIQPSISFMNEVMSLFVPNEIQRADSDNNVPGLKPSYKKVNI